MCVREREGVCGVHVGYLWVWVGIRVREWSKNASAHVCSIIYTGRDMKEL